MTAGRLWIDSATVVEGASGSQLMTFTVRRVGGSDPFDVNFSTSDGLASTADGDYVAAAGVLHFGLGVETQTFSVAVNGDSKFELDELFIANLSAPTNGAVIAQGQAYGVILNDDATSGPGTVWINNTSVTEGDSGTKTMTFTVTRSGTGAFSVNYQQENSSATPGDDFVPLASGVLTFGANEVSKTISVTVNGDTTFEQTSKSP